MNENSNVEPVETPAPATPEAPAIPETPATPDPFQPPTPPKKSRKGLIITLIIVLVVLIVAAAAFIFFRPKAGDTAINAQDTPAQTNTGTTEQPEDTEDYAQGWIDKIRASLADQLGSAYPTLPNESSDGVPIYKVPGTGYYILGGDFGKGFSLQAGVQTPTSIKAEQVINDTLAGDTSLTKADSEWRVTYQNDKVICNVLGGGSPITVTCANIRDYAGTIAQLKPFVEAYLASEEGKAYGEGVGFGMVTITDKNDGYQTATIGMGSGESPVGGYAGLFYAKDGKWSYFTGTQSVLSCSQYNTHDIQKAYEGEQCYDEATENDSAKVTVTL